MAVRKATIQEQINAAIAQANPGDRTHVSIQAIAGPNPMLMSMLGIIGQSFLTYYFVTVTDQAVLIHKASRMSNRPQEIVHALPLLPRPCARSATSGAAACGARSASSSRTAPSRSR